MKSLFIAVVVLFGFAASAQTVSGISANSGQSGDTIAIYGSGLTGTTAVSFGGVASTSVTVVSDTQVNATVPTGFSFGTVAVTIGGIQVFTGNYFTVASSTSGITMALNTIPLDPRLVYDPKAGTTTLWASGFGSVLSALIQTSADHSAAGSVDWTGRVIWSGQQNRAGYLCYASDSAGALYARISSSNQLIASIRGVEDLGAPITGVFEGDELEWRVTYEATAFANYFLEYRINGVACQDCRISQGGPSTPAIPTPTAFYVGSDNNGQNSFPSTPSYFSSVPYTTNIANRNYEFVVLGDSISAGAASGLSQWAITSSQIYKSEERWLRPGIYSLAAGGSTIAIQKARWDASAIKGVSSIKAVIILIGVNDAIVSNHDGPTIISDLQGLVTDVHTANPTAKIILVQIPPVKGAATTGQWTAIQAVNSAIASFGSSFVNVDAGVVVHYALLNDGTDNYRSWLTMGDHLHPNNPGRKIIARAERAAIVGLGLLPN